MARRIRTREVLRLRSVNGLSQNAIARTAHVSKHSVRDVLEAAREQGVSREDVEGMSEEAAYALLFPGRGDAGRCTPTPTGHASTASSRGDRRHAQAPARGVCRRVRGGRRAVDVLRQVLQALPPVHGVAQRGEPRRAQGGQEHGGRLVGGPRCGSWTPRPARSGRCTCSWPASRSAGTATSSRRST